MLVKINELCNKNSPYYQLGVRWNGIETIEKHGILEIVDINSVKYVELEKLLKHIEWEKKFLKEHLIDLEVWEVLGSSANKDTLRTSGIKRLISMSEQGLIEMVELNYQLLSIRDNKYKNIKRFFRKASVEKFLYDYIKLNEAMNLMEKKDLGYTLKILVSKNIPIVKLSKKYDMTFAKRKDVEQLVRNGENKLSNEEVREKTIHTDLPEFLNKTQVKILLGLNKKLKLLLELGVMNVETKIINNKVYYNKSQLINFRQKQEAWEKTFLKGHLIDLEVWELFGSKSSRDTLRSNGISKLIELAEQGKFEYVQLNYPLIFNSEKKYENIKRFFRKESVEIFLNTHYKLNQAMEILGRKSSSEFLKFLKSKGIEIIKVTSKLDMMFVSKLDIHQLIENKNERISEEEKLKRDLENAKFLNRKQIMSYLNITTKRLNQMLDKGLIQVEKKISNNLTLYRKERVIKLKEQQEKLLKILQDKWYTRNEVLEKFNYDPDGYDIRKIKIPVLVASHDNYINKRIVYLKSSVKEIYENIKYNQHYYTDVGTIYDNVQHRLQMDNLTFPKSLCETEHLWDIYVKAKSKKWNPHNYDDKMQRINIIVTLTKELSSSLTKEIFNCSSKELNFLFFNKIVSLHLQKYLFSFLQAIHLSQKMQNKVTFKITQLNNPYDREQKRITKDLYSPKEYRGFFEYISIPKNVSLHKRKAIESIKMAVQANEEKKNINNVYDRYDSAWLFVILHLTNIWRTPDYTNFPRVSFKDTSIEPTIEWIENNKISKPDAERLLRRLQIKTYKFSKNNLDRYLFIPDKLLMAFAYAITLCEIRTRLLNDNDQSIINFMTSDNRFKNKPKDSFFKAFKSNVSFETLKMNRTLYSFTLTISKEENGPHELEILKQFRGHKNIETTNIYLLFTQEEINFLTSQLFSRNDHFGFIADTFTNILFGETTSLEEKTKLNNDLIDSFGDIFKLEALANFLLTSTNDEEILKEIILEMDSQEIQQKYEEILFMQLPSKQKDVQCLIGHVNCPYPGRNCLGGCHYSIPHFYAISELSRQLWNDFEFILNEFSTLKYKGDKERFLINFAGRLKLFKRAGLKYGEVVYEFLKLDKEKWRMLLSNLPEEWQQFVSYNKVLIKN
ncbi:hypothetical protein [Bacillus sp. 1P02SD]|uniref:hypothetical protein n=1 Tax=Bacillus sp. 1P02SD TaxID=3132264 RepID=UPI0039A0C4FF